MTIRRMMLAVLLVACCLGFWAYLRRWEARRVVMYQQRDVTYAIMAEAYGIASAAGHSRVSFRQERDSKTYTSRWTERLEVFEVRDGPDVPLIRAVISGANGRFKTPPIIVETYGFPLDSHWLDHLLHAYRAKGWRYRVVRRPNPP
jgi:hypothetical protein